MLCIKLILIDIAFFMLFYRIYHDDYHFEKLLFIKPDTPNKDMNILQ